MSELLHLMMLLVTVTCLFQRNRPLLFVQDTLSLKQRLAIACDLLLLTTVEISSVSHSCLLIRLRRLGCLELLSFAGELHLCARRIDGDACCCLRVRRGCCQAILLELMGLL